MKPSFFKVMINGSSSPLQIPPYFVKKYGKQIPNKAKIEACDGKLWEVEVQKMGGKFSFSKGWGNFAEENKVKFGDFLLFKLLADSSTFKVNIYGKTCCVKEFPSEHLNGNNAKEKEADQKKVGDQGKRKWVDEVVFDDDDDDYNKNEELRGGARRKNSEFEKEKDFEEDVIEIDSDSFHDKSRISEQRRWKERTKAEEEEIKFNSEYPFFQVKLTSSNITGYLYIPKHFRQQMNMKKKEQKVKFQICNEFYCTGFHFIYEVRHGTLRELRISQGWRQFVKKYDLKLEDLCIFEMIKSDGDGDDDDDEVIFIVHVHRWDGAKSEFVKIY
ncbi:putative B3 domain-containing protein [Senna tora]|uniref:Putative B3 domain-containing protein n=1 Tax=Senna tora TaxID=362788 RepID=A0A835CJY6_9FABA|nr:putative B3 domain-containing protein [Senna tora]